MSGPPMETWWLVERGPAVNHTPTLYWVKDGAWTEKPWDAAWFGTRQEAEDQVLRVSAHRSKPLATAVEHAFEVHR